MPYDAEERDSEARKLEALTAIGVAISLLSTNLMTMARENIDQSSLLRRMDEKLDRILVASEARGLSDGRR